VTTPVSGNLYINGRLYWKTRTPTKRGSVDPYTRTSSMYANQASTAQRRREQRAYERHFEQDHVQLLPDTLVIWERKPYRVVEVKEVPDDLWGDELDELFQHTVEAWEKRSFGRPKPKRPTWKQRPVMILLRADGQTDAKPIHLRARASHEWAVLPEHYAVCRLCNELPPCQHEIDENNIEATMNRAEDLMAIQPGCCLGCTEPITSRMKAVRFPGPNLWRPDMPENSAVFHARAECASDVHRYKEQWEQKNDAPPIQPELPGAAGDDA